MNNTTKIPYDSELMVAAAKALPCRSVLTGKWIDLVAILQKHIRYMISRHDCNHDNHGARFDEIAKIIHGTIMEVVAMSSYPKSWPDGATEQFKLWKYSPKHWVAINSVARYYCYSMGMKDGFYYGMGIIIK